MESSFQRRGRRFRDKTLAREPPATASTASPSTPDASARGAGTLGGGSGGGGVGGAGESPPPVAAAPGAPAAGTRPGLYGQTLISTGLAEFDDLVGGGLPLGSVTLIGSYGANESSRDVGHAGTFARYFVAEGVASGHRGLWMPPTSGARDVARALPRIVSPDDAAARDDDDDDDGGAAAGGDDGLRIAWQYRRYLRQGKALDDSRVGRGRDGLGAGVSASGGSSTSASARSKSRRNTGGVVRLPEMCHAFDLTREMDPATIAAATLRREPFEPRTSLSDLARGRGGTAGAEDETSATTRRARRTRDRLRRALDACASFRRDCDAAGPGVVGRVVVHPPVDYIDVGGPSVEAAGEFALFLSALRATLGGGAVAAMVVFPVAACDAASAAKLRHASDACVELSSLSSPAGALEQLLPDPRLCVGLVRVRKLSFPGVVGASPLTKMDHAYALQIRRRRMAIRPLQLSPEDAGGGGGGGVGGSGGEGKPKSASAGLCGGPPNATKAYDF